MKTKIDGICTLLVEANRNRLSLTGYQRAIRACKVLSLDEYETRLVLSHLDYVDSNGKRWNWLEKAIEAAAGKKAKISHKDILRQVMQ